MNLRDIFDNVTEPIYLDRMHITDFGNDIVAKKLFEEILPIVKMEVGSQP